MRTLVILFCFFLALSMAVPSRFVLRNNKREEDDCPAITCAEDGQSCGEVLGSGSNEYETSCVAPLLCISNGQSAKCQTHVPIGGKCLESWECNDQEVNAVANYCSKGVCTPSRKFGEPCTDADDACLDPLFCNDSGLCDNEFTRQFNESCDDDHECVETLQCVEGVCAPYAQLGAVCGDPEDGMPACDYDFTCYQGKCAPIASVPEGGECEFTLSCIKGLVCDQNEVCAKPSLNDTEVACETSDDCDSSSICGCDFEEGRSACFPLAPWDPDTMQKYQDYSNCMKTHNNDQYQCGPQLEEWSVSDPDEVITDQDLWCMV